MNPEEMKLLLLLRTTPAIDITLEYSSASCFVSYKNLVKPPSPGGMMTGGQVGRYTHGGVT